jgi:NADH-quinone oxidoreductase subunit F
VKQTGQPKAATFDELKRQAEKHWRELQGAKAFVMVGAATCGRAAGALEVLRAIKDELKKHNLDCPVFEVGCMGHCYA